MGFFKRNDSCVESGSNLTCGKRDVSHENSSRSPLRGCYLVSDLHILGEPSRLRKVKLVNLGEENDL